MDKKILSQYENIALSDAHLFTILGGKNTMILYPDLVKYDNIDQILGKNGMCVLLFEAQAGYGHWVCLWKTKNTVSFFNSYGGYPDDSLEYIPEHFARMNNEDYPYLSLLLEKSPYKLTFNEHVYQKSGADIKTCGRHVAVRLFAKHLNDSQYNDYVNTFCKDYDINPDQFVTLMTLPIEKL